MPLETIIYIAGLVLTIGALGGMAWLGFTELRVRALRRGHQQQAQAVDQGVEGQRVHRATAACRSCAA